MKRHNKDDDSTDESRSYTQLLFGVTNENPHIQPIGSDVLCRDTATLDDLDNFLRREWFSDGHLSLFCPWSKRKKIYEQLDHPIWPRTTTLSSASENGEKIVYLYDLGIETRLIFTLKKKISSKKPLASPVVAHQLGPQLSESQSSELQDVAGGLDVAFPHLSDACRSQATVEIGKPLKGNNPWITRDSPFYSTIFDEGGEYASGPAHSGNYRGMYVELKALDDVTRSHFGNGDEDEDEDSEEEPRFDFEKNFPKVHKWMGAPGKNWLEFGRERPGAFFKAFKGKNIVFSTNEFQHLHSCFQAFELFLK